MEWNKQKELLHSTLLEQRKQLEKLAKFHKFLERVVAHSGSKERCEDRLIALAEEDKELKGTIELLLDIIDGLEV